MSAEHTAPAMACRRTSSPFLRALIAQINAANGVHGKPMFSSSAGTDMDKSAVT